MAHAETPAPPARRRSDPQDLTPIKVIMWGLIPLLSVVFAAGGGWLQLAALDRRVELLEVQRDLYAEQSLPRRVHALEEAIQAVDDLQRLHSSKLVAICVATGAKCPEGP